MTLAEDLTLLCVFTAVSSLTVALRVIARCKTEVGFKADDIWIFAALVLNFAYFGTAVWGMLNQHLYTFKFAYGHLQVISRQMATPI
jgi:hypothetical protein